MARPPRLSLPSYPHHVTQRGNNRQPIFLAPNDYEVFLECLREAKRKCRARLYAYVLMTNHVHLLVEPEQEGGLGRFMQSVGRRYVRYINDAHARTGTLWEGRFKSAVVSRDEYLIMCSRYIELNPVRAGMVRHPQDYRWSSYHRRALGRPDELLDEDPWYVSLGKTTQDRVRVYASWLEASISDKEWELIRRATQQGRVVGSDSFQEAIGSHVGRRLKGETRGRPKRADRPSEIAL
ncbi:MAG: transposase [Nitrospira sp.]|nr:transposase [Nitrospira sp.]MDH4371406.1 transposase [Nitrospira sp.]MDH5347318.1 transposase [Nitrospira sp.]MDH5499011.1 transposase [Nitrospira sp.]